MRHLPATFLALLFSVRAGADPLSFAIYHLTGGEPVLLAQDRLDYTASDIEVMEWGSEQGSTLWKKSLKLADGFRVGALVMRTEPDAGFGMWVEDENHPDGFSWEWFSHDHENIFKNGDGRVRIGFAKADIGVMIHSIEFLTDVKLGFNDHVKSQPGQMTHEVVVSQGSILRFPD